MSGGGAAGRLSAHECTFACPAAVLSMGLKATVADVTELLMAIGAEDRLIQLDEFEQVVMAHLKAAEAAKRNAGSTQPAPAATVAPVIKRANAPSSERRNSVEKIANEADRVARKVIEIQVSLFVEHLS